MKDNPEHWGAVMDGLQSIIPNIASAFFAGAIRYGMLIYDGETRKNKWIEGLVCGAFAGCTASIIGLIPGLPEDAAKVLPPVIGGIIGFIGADKLREIAIAAIEKKAGINQSADK